MKKRIVFDIPAGTPQKSCLSCGKAIWFVHCGGPKPMPVNADGESHFATCHDAPKFRGKTRAEIRQGDLFGKGGKT